MRSELQPGSGFVEGLASFEQSDSETLAAEAECGRQPANAGSSNEDRLAGPAAQTALSLAR